jgi:4-amino-4-deoxy-L-arabinose transferase-like glycosyltransferase
MLTRLKRSPELIFAVFGAYFAVQLCVRMALPHSLELDESAQVFYAQWLAAGYDTQPPFYNWVQAVVIELLGSNLFSLVLLKNLLLLGTFSLYAAAGMAILRSKELALVAALGLLTFPQISFESQRDLTHSVAVVFSACLFIYALVSTLSAPNRWRYALLGLSVGIGMLSKYNFLILPVAAFFAVLPERDFRSRLFDWRLLIAVSVAILIFLPHGIWLLQNVDLATQGTINKLSGAETSSKMMQVLAGLGSLAGALVGFGGLTLLAFAVIYGRELTKALPQQNRWSGLIGRMMLAAIGLLVLLVLVTDSTNIKDRWLSPIFILLPLYFATKLDHPSTSGGHLLDRFWLMARLLLVVLPVVMLLRVPLHGLAANYTKLNIDYETALTMALADKPAQPDFILASDVHLAGNLKLNADDLVVYMPGYRTLIGDVVHATGKPILTIWRDNGRGEPVMPDSMVNWLSQFGTLGPVEPRRIEVPYNFGRNGAVYHFSYAYVWPKAK